MTRLAVGIGLVLVLAGCGSSSPTPSGNPPGWDFVTTCDHGNRLYFSPGTGYGGSLAVAAQDPTCSK